MIDYSKLLDYIYEHRLYDSDYHGLEHWNQVEFNGILLAQKTGADLKVIRLFAMFHDSKRINDTYDPEHGPRAEAFIRQCVSKRIFELEKDSLEKLSLACRLHTKEHKTGDITIDTCFDADRLDLGRVGICPQEEKMATTAGKEIAKKLSTMKISVYEHRQWIKKFHFSENGNNCK